MSLRSLMRSFVPPWLSDMLPAAPSYGHRVLFGLALQADAFVDWVLEGSRAALPGLGTSTALPAIARSRGIVRGRVEDEAGHVDRLVRWLDLLADMGTMRGMTREIQHYLGQTAGGQWHTVMCVSRSGVWGIRRGDGEYVYYDAADVAATAWDYDSVSNPEFAECWADMWIIIQPPPYETHLAWWWPSPDSGLGHDSPQVEVATIRELVNTWKAARTRVRAIIWSPTHVPAGYPLAGAVAFDPLPGGPSPFVPDGTWGSWARLDGAGNSVPSRPEWLRFWEMS